MLPKGQRVGVDLFEELRTKGMRHHSPHFLLYVLPQKDSSLSRWSVAVPKKVASKATERNQLKRKVNGFIQKNKKILPSGWTGIFFIKNRLEKVNEELLGSELTTLLKRLNAS